MLVLALLAILRCGDLCAPQAFLWYSELLAEGGYGRLPHEKAAFLVRERDGSLTMAPWEKSEIQRASFCGTIPPRTIAIVHTHPGRWPQPSAHDRAAARRIGVPVIVVTQDAVVAAMPLGDDLVVASRRGWAAK